MPRPIQKVRRCSRNSRGILLSSAGPEGRNVRIDVRWGGSNVDLLHTFAKELIGLQPDVLLASSSPTTAVLAGETQTIPIIFALIADPIGSRFVMSLSHPGGNITGFSVIEASVVSKSIELLRELAPGIKRVAMMFNPDTAPIIVNSMVMPVFETTAKSFNIAPITAPVHSDAEIETLITSLGSEPGDALFGAPDNFLTNHRATIIRCLRRSRPTSREWRSWLIRREPPMNTSCGTPRPRHPLLESKSSPVLSTTLPTLSA
jgi:putative ABC transport system substrate-binding protein